MVTWLAFTAGEIIPLPGELQARLHQQGKQMVLLPMNVA